MCQEKRSQLHSFNTIKTFTLAHHDGGAELADTPGFKGGRGAAVKELTLQRGLFIGTNRCPPPAQRPTESSSFCSSPWTAGNWRAHGRAAAPVQRFDFLEWQLDELRREELGLWRSNYAASQEKNSSGLCRACLHNAKWAGAPWDGCCNREDAFQRVSYSPEILKGCFLDHAEECKLLKSRMP